MGDGKLFRVVLIIGALTAGLLAGCGGGSGSSTTDSSSSAGSGSTSESSTATDSTADSGESEASAEFIRPGKKNKEVEFGQEADVAEREAASAVLEENLQARASGDWEGQCSSLTAEAVKVVEESAAKKGCAESLEALAQPISKSKAVRADTMTEPVAALRVKGDKAFALYHGAKGRDYAISLTKEGGEWKVATIQERVIP
jgi:hypothetical protein